MKIPFRHNHHWRILVQLPASDLPINGVKPLPRAISMALAIAASMSLSLNLYGQTTPPKTPEEIAKEEAAKKTELAKKPAQIETVVVTGIRASLEKSLDVKRDASANVEVITAEDIGKMPDKNLADSLQRLAGVAVRTDYDEAEKVSIRGTNPDMSLILFNGHTVSGGDWYVADQGSSSRSTSLSLMPSSVLNQALVYKTSQANIVDGGLAGTINVTTRKPLDGKKVSAAWRVWVGCMRICQTKHPATSTPRSPGKTTRARWV
jgi:iron complex outermembrane recepter protein